MRNMKLAVLPTLVIFGLLMTGFAYAGWSQTIYIEGSVASGTLCARFVPPVTRTDHGLDWNCGEGFVDPYPHEVDEDVGSSSAEIVADGKVVEVNLVNVYPCYYELMTFTVHNCGTIPWKIQKVVFDPGGIEIDKPGYLTLDLNDDGKADVEIYWGSGFGTQREYCEKLNISFEIHVLQDAPQGKPLAFTATIVVVQCDQYVPPEP